MKMFLLFGKCSIAAAILLISCSCASSSPNTAGPVQTPENYNQAKVMYTRGHESFIAGRYEEAEGLYRAVDAFIDKNPSFRDYFDHAYRGFSMIDMVRRHKALGENSPEAVHRVLVIYVDSVNAPYEGGMITSHITESIKETERKSREVCKRLLEVLSDGKLSLSFDEVHLKAAITEIESENAFDSRAPADRMIESITPYPGDCIYQNLDEYDSFIFYWDHVNDDGNRLYTGYHGWGGMSRLPLIPYQLYAPPRGRIVISAGLIHRPGTILHELFHTFEKAYNISPIHGFRDSIRNNFPGWKGEGELDYYEYQIKRNLDSLGCTNFLLADRFPSPITQNFYIRTLENAEAPGIDSRKKSRMLVQRARALSKSKSDTALELYHQALTLNPNNPQALLRLTVMYHESGNKAEALSYILRAYENDPLDPEICYWMGVEHYHAGEYEQSLRYLSEALRLDPALIKAETYRDFVRDKIGTE